MYKTCGSVRGGGDGVVVGRGLCAGGFRARCHSQPDGDSGLGGCVLSLSQLAAIHRRVCTSRSSWWPGGTPAAGRGSARGWTPGRVSVATLVLHPPFRRFLLRLLLYFLHPRVAFRERVKVASARLAGDSRPLARKKNSPLATAMSATRVPRRCDASAARW